MELDRRHSSGVARAGLTTGIIGTALSTLGILGGGAGLLAGAGRSSNVETVVVPVPMNNGLGFSAYSNSDNCGCSENHLVNRYELELTQKLAEKDSQIAMRDANTYNDQKMLEMYKYMDGRFQEFEKALCDQAVTNQATKDSFQLVQQEQQCCCDKLDARIDNERRERRCADNSIVTYANATFYPKQVADVTTGTTSTPQATYNPLPVETCGCNCGNR